MIKSPFASNRSRMRYFLFDMTTAACLAALAARFLTRGEPAWSTPAEPDCPDAAAAFGAAKGAPNALINTPL